MGNLLLLWIKILVTYNWTAVTVLLLLLLTWSVSDMRLHVECGWLFHWIDKMRLSMSVVETAYIRLELLDNGILVATYKKQKLITLEMAREIVQTRLDFVGLEPRPVLVLNEGVIQLDKGARKWVASGDGVVGISASAVIADHPGTFFIMALIFTIERPPMPARVYRSRDRAMAWLETFL